MEDAGKEPYNATEQDVIKEGVELDNKVDKDTEAEKTANSSISPELPTTPRAGNDSEVGGTSFPTHEEAI